MDPMIVFITAARVVLQVATLVLVARLIWRMRPKGAAHCALVAGIMTAVLLLVMLLQFEVVTRQVAPASALLPLPAFRGLLVVVWMLILTAVILVGPIIDRMRRAEETLIDQQQLLEQIQDLAPVGISMTDEDGRFVYVNRAFCEINCRGENELIGRSFTEVVAPEWRPSAAEFHRKFIAGEPVPPPPEQALAGLDGVGRIVILRHRRLVRQDGRRYRLATTIDITERKAAEEAFRESEQRFRQFAENVPHVVWMAEPEQLRIVYLNSAWERVTGQSRQRVLAAAANWLEVIHRDDLDRVKTALPGLVAGPFDIEFRVVRPDGAIRWLRDVGMPIRSESGETYLLAGIAEDITDRKLAEDALRERDTRFRAFTENSNVGFWHSDNQGRMVHANAAMSRMLDFDSPTELVGLESASFFAPESQETFRREQIKRRAGQASTYEATFVGRNGGHRHVIIHAAPMLDDHGRCAASSALAPTSPTANRPKRGTSSRRLIWRTSPASPRSAKCSPASPMKSTSRCTRSRISPAPANGRSTIRSRPLDGKVREWVEQIAKSALRAGAIVNRLRGFARRGAPQVASVRLHEVIEEAAEIMAAEARRLRASVRFDLCPGDPVVQVDRVQIQQVLVNLLKNAFEAMQDVPLDARITTVRSSMFPDRFEVSVHDQGAGISTEDEPRLFEAFFTTKPDGMGLGLAVSRTIIQAHGGSIGASRGPGPGSTFHFTLPVDGARRSLD